MLCCDICILYCTTLYCICIFCTKYITIFMLFCVLLYFVILYLHLYLICILVISRSHSKLPKGKLNIQSSWGYPFRGGKIIPLKEGWSGATFLTMGRLS